MYVLFFFFLNDSSMGQIKGCHRTDLALWPVLGDSAVIRVCKYKSCCFRSDSVSQEYILELVFAGSDMDFPFQFFLLWVNQVEFNSIILMYVPNCSSPSSFYCERLNNYHPWPSCSAFCYQWVKSPYERYSVIRFAYHDLLLC